MENNITPTITLAKLYESQNQFIDAIQIYTKLLELNPSDEIKTKVETLTNKIYTLIVKNYNRQINTIFSKFELKYFKILPNKEFLHSSETTEIEKEKDIPEETKKRKKTRKPDEDLKAKNTESESEDIEKSTPASFHYAETGPTSPATAGFTGTKERKKESIIKEPVLHSEIQEITNGKDSQVEKVETLTQKEKVQKDVGEKQPEEIEEEQIQNEKQETAVFEQAVEKDIVDKKKESNDIKAVLKELNEIKETISKDREVFFTKMYEIDKKLKEIDIDEIKEVINLDKKSNEKEKDK